MRNSNRKALRFVLLFLTILAALLALGYAGLMRIDRRNRENAGYIADNAIGRLMNVYSNYMLSAKSIGGYVSGRRGIFTGIEAIAENYLQNIDGIASIQLAPDGITRLCMPEGSGETGFNILTQDAKKEDAVEVRDSHISIMSGPYTMKNGASSLVLRTPVIITDDYGRESFWGFSSVVIDMGQFFKTAGIKRINDLGYSYQIWMNDRADNLIFDGIIGEFESPVTKLFKYGGKNWSIYIEPQHGWISRSETTFMIAASFLMALILSMLDTLCVRLLHKNIALKKQTQRLRQSEKNERLLRNSYEAAVESAELFLWELNLSDGSARLSDNPFTKRFGELHKIPKEIPNLIQYAREHCTEKDAQALDDIFSSIRRGNRNVSTQIHFRSDGDMRVHTVKINYLIVCDDYGKAIKGYGAAQDLTEDSAKRDGYNQERAFFSSYQGQDMVLRVRVDLTTDEILDCKPYIPTLIGTSYSEATLSGKGMEFLIENGKPAREVLNREKMLQSFSMGSRISTYDYKIGKVGSQMSWAQGVAKMFESPDNKHVEMFFYAYNISKQKNEQLLIGSVINSVYEKIGIIDLPEGNFRNFIVKKEIIADSGMSYDEYMRGTVATRYIPELDQASFIEAVKLETVMREMEGQEQYVYQTPYLEMKDDGKVRNSYKLLRFFYIDEACSGIIVCVSDVTRQCDREMAQKEALKEALSKAESANMAKSEFVSRISHDIRTPIGAIQNLTQFAKKDADNKEKLMHDLEQIETSNKFLLSLINDVLDISKVDKGQIKLSPEPYPYREYIDGLKNIIEPMCLNKGLHWQINDAKEGYGGAAVIDRIRLNQITLNLLSNAVKYTPECGEVTFTSKSHRTDDGGFVLAFEVKDTGIGMSEEFQKHMFEEFSQEYDNSQRPKGITGTGLGLAIVKRMVDLMGGTLSVESALGVGTTINVEIPCEFQTEEQMLEAGKKDADYEKQNEDVKIRLPGKVLLAEDNPINVDIAMTILDMFGCEVDHAENGKEAVEMFAFSKPKEYSVILMDIQMPFMDGYEATKRIRALKRDDAKAIPIIAMTADAFEDARQRAYNAGVDDYLTKPLNPRELKRRLLDIS